MDRHSLLAAVSTAQLAAGVVGLVIAARRRLPGEPLWTQEPLSPAHLRRNAVFLGTALSAPVLMMAVQGWAIPRLVTRHDERAAHTLGVIGVLMTGGCLVERDSPIWPGHGDRVTTPVFLASLAGAVAMGRLGLGRPTT